MMPGIDGTEVCRRTRETRKNVYIIMLTARGSKEDTRRRTRVGSERLYRQAL